MFIVIFDDDQGLCVPYALDQDNEGALHAISRGDAVAIFKSMDDAKRAIRISRKLAELDQARGHPGNDDFLLPGVLCVKIRKCEVVESSKEGSDHAR